MSFFFLLRILVFLWKIQRAINALVSKVSDESRIKSKAFNKYSDTMTEGHNAITKHLPFPRRIVHLT